MAATLPRINTHREPTPIVIGKNVEGFNPWAGCVRSRTGGIRLVPTQFLGKLLI